jgi:hypothetical protein
MYVLGYPPLVTSCSEAGLTHAVCRRLRGIKTERGNQQDSATSVHSRSPFKGLLRAQRLVSLGDKHRNASEIGGYSPLAVSERFLCFLHFPCRGECLYERILIRNKLHA